jgi:Tol biopolymer transport system component
MGTGCGLFPKAPAYTPPPQTPAQPVAEPLPEAPTISPAATQITRITKGLKNVVSIDIDQDESRMLYTTSTEYADETYINSSHMVFLNKGGQVLLAEDNLGHPTWLPGSDEYIAVHWKNERWQLVRKNIQSPKTTFVNSMSSGNNIRPSVSPDGTMIAFVHKENDTSQIATIKADGSSYTIYTDGYSARWRPDGKALAYGNKGQIYELELSSGTVTQLTFENSNMHHTSPVYSPDGEWIAFSAAGDDEINHIWAMRRDGSERTQLTNDSLDEQMPFWSSTGHLYFVAEGQSGEQSEGDIWRITPKL